MDGILAISTILLAGIWLSERIKHWREDDRRVKDEQQYQATVAVKYPRSEIGPLPESRATMTTSAITGSKPLAR